MKTAYSYIRFSTAEQEEGDSLRRQLELSRDYAAQNGFTLNESLKPDRGVSAFQGRNRTEGNLAAFLARVKDGSVKKGSALFVESLDRLSREEVEEALYGFLDIIRSGVEIHTLSRTRTQVYRKGQLKTEQLVISIFEMARANEESEFKSERVGKKWGDKKHNTPDGVVVTKWMPSWLEGKAAKRGEPAEKIRVNEERAEIVREIFRLAADGHGKRMIARILNERGVPSFTGGTWGHSYIGKLLHSRAPLGEWQPCFKDGTPDGEPHPNHFPQIVDAALYQKARRALESRRTITDNGDVTGKYAGRAGSMRNLFSSLVWDASGGSFEAAVKMSYKTLGKRAKPRLVTEKTGPERAHSVDYGKFENAFLAFLDDLDWREILGETESADLKNCEQEHARITLEIEGMERQAQNILDSMAAAPSKLAAERLVKLEAGIEQKKTARETAEKRQADLQQKSRDLLDSSVAFVKLSKATDLVTRSRLREGIRRKVSGIYFLAFNAKSSDGQTYSGALIRFTNGAERMVMILRDRTIVVWLHEKQPKGPPEAWLKGQPKVWFKGKA
jgi:DNA invertase Pin-like site-specific DNA recombinase